MQQAADPFVSPNSSNRIGLIAGRGDLPALLIQAARQQARDIFVLAIKGDTRPEILEGVPHSWIELTELPHTLEIFRREQITDVLMAGGLSRPSFKAFRPSLLTTRLLARIGKAFFGGDDALLRAIVTIFEEEGFHILGADELLKELLTPEGGLTLAKPSQEAQEDIRRGILLMREIGKLDIGQSLIIRHGQVLGVEALEGTDALILRCGKMAMQFKEPYKGILVKCRKPGQEQRVDLPSIGPETIRNLHQAGFAGIAIEAGGSLMIRKEEMIHLANTLGIFVEGFHEQ